MIGASVSATGSTWALPADIRARVSESSNCSSFGLFTRRRSTRSACSSSTLLALLPLLELPSSEPMLTGPTTRKRLPPHEQGEDRVDDPDNVFPFSPGVEDKSSLATRCHRLPI